MAEQRLCAVSDLPEGAAKVFEIGDVRLAAARAGNAVFVVEDRCSHDDGELGEGVLVETEIECPRHGARFEMSTGIATRMPAIAPIETFAARIDGDDVMVDIPEY
jgi:3-phenylpropionate/trans-cinnamate dioxygenase ferredoxin subunit